MNSRRIIKSQGIGEIFLDDWKCYPAEHFSFNRHKEIPFFKLLLEFNSSYLKYQNYLHEVNIFNRIIIRELYEESIELLNSFEHLEELCEDLYVTGQISNMYEAIINFYKFMNNEPFDFFDLGEIKEIMDFIFIELEHFKKKFIKVTELLPFIMGKDLITAKIIKKDFIYQLLYR